MERTELYGLPRQDFLFVLKNVACTPTAPRQKEVITIKGEVDLFKIPFFAPVWVIASVTYPQKWWEFLLGSPTVHEMTVAIGGKFEIKFAEGFDREGEYTLAVNLYFGPTKTTTMGTLKSVTLPPLPSLDTYEAKFTVSGEVPEEEINFTLGQPTASPATVLPGQTVTITCPITSACTSQQTVTVKVNIYEGSALAGAGTLLSTKTSQSFSIAPGQSYNVIVTDTAVQGTIDRRDVGVEVYIGANKVASGQFDDVFYVTAAALAFDLGQPTINNLIQPTNIALGTDIAIVCSIISRCSTTQTVTVKVNIDEGSAWGTPGSLIGTFASGPSSIAPNGTLNVTINTTAKGATDRKDIEVWVYVGGVEKAYNHFDDAFWVTSAPPPPTQYALTTSISPSGSGTVSPSSGSWDIGYTMTIQAFANPGYQFDHWGGDASGTSPSVTITMNSNKSVVAYFIAAPAGTYVLNVSANPNNAGYVTKKPDNPKYVPGTSVLITAYVTSSYWAFDHWSGDAIGTWGQIAVVMDGDRDVVANFKVNPYY